MKTASLLLAGAASLGIGLAAMAGEPVTTVVSIHYSVRENNPEKLIEAVTHPVERSMRELDRVAKIGSTTSHGVVEVQIEFQGNATAQDVAVVTAQVARLKFGQDVAILSRTIELGSRNPLIWP
jgi:multidrug efflux pump subunit AcrB